MICLNTARTLMYDCLCCRAPFAPRLPLSLLPCRPGTSAFWGRSRALFIMNMDFVFDFRVSDTFFFFGCVLNNMRQSNEIHDFVSYQTKGLNSLRFNFVIVKKKKKTVLRKALERAALVNLKSGEIFFLHDCLYLSLSLSTSVLPYLLELYALAYLSVLAPPSVRHTVCVCFLFTCVTTPKAEKTKPN